MIGAMAHVQGLGITSEKFVSHFIHDLRACLRATGTLPDWIIEDLEGLEDVIPPDVYQYLSDIKVNALRADMLINATRELCTLEWAEEPSTPVELGEVIKETISDFPLPEGFEIDLQVTKQSCTIPYQSFKYVLTELLTNACKHHGAAAGVVRVANIGTDGALHVADDGAGIPESYHGSIFDPFTSLKPKDVVEGSGLGLTIARRRVELWGGTLSIVRDPTSKGASFRVTFGDVT